MARTLRFVLLAIFSTSAVGQTQQAPQTWSGLLSDSKCGMSHQTMSAAASMTERECAFHCLKALATYVLVDQNGTVLPIANQNFPGLPLRLARPVRITGLLTVAANDARVAAAHALLASKSATLDEVKMHAGHVLHALDPTIEPKGPASGYGAKKSAAGGLQHVGFAASVEDASPAVKTHAGVVSAKLSDAIVAIDRAIATVQRIRAAAAQGEALSLTSELGSQISQISEGIESAQQEMRVMMKAEGL